MRLLLLWRKKALGYYSKLHAWPALETEVAHRLLHTKLCPVYTPDVTLDGGEARGTRSWHIVCKVGSQDLPKSLCQRSLGGGVWI